MIKCKCNFNVEIFNLIKANIRFNGNTCTRKCKYRGLTHCALFHSYLGKSFNTLQDCKNLFFTAINNKNVKSINKILQGIPDHNDCWVCFYHSTKPNHWCNLFKRSLLYGERYDDCINFKKSDYIL